MRVNVKPLSVNEAWKGRRYKTDKYLAYETELFYKLKPITIPKGKLEINYTVGYSNKQSDIDNFLKSFTDILQKKYNFNDNLIYKLSVVKEIVKKGDEFIEFEIKSYE